MNRSLMDFWVGLFVLLGLAAITFLALKVANQASIGGSNSFVVTGYFYNVGGLKVRAPVKSAGVTIGRVESIDLDTQTYQAKVSLAIDEAYELSSDTSAGIFTSGLLGEQYVSLETGGEASRLKQGDQIRLTSSALVLEHLIGQFVTGMSASGAKE